MVIETTEILTGAAIVLVTGAIGTVAKHIYNRSKHPCQDELDKKIEKKVDTEVCKARENCVESEIKAVNNRLVDMQISIIARFDTMEGYFMRILDKPKS